MEHRVAILFLQQLLQLVVVMAAVLYHKELQMLAEQVVQVAAVVLGLLLAAVQVVPLALALHLQYKDLMAGLVMVLLATLQAAAVEQHLVQLHLEDIKVLVQR
jgi:hypothetical protein